MPRARSHHWRLIVLLFLLAIALLDVKLEPSRKSLTILWKPTSRLRIGEGVRLIGHGITRLWKATPADSGLHVTPVGRLKPPAGSRAAPSKPRPAASPGALDQHSEEDRRRLDRAVSGN